MGEQGVYEQWKSMGDEIQEISNRLTAFMCNPGHQELMTAKLSDTLCRALEHIEKFRCRADSRMFDKVNPPWSENEKWFRVFYGSGAEK